MSVQVLAAIAALLGFIGREIMAIVPGIRDDQNSPDKFSLSYYLSRPKNQLLIALNACGSGILFLARHEVMALSSLIPLLSDYLGDGTPILLGGAIGFSGAHVLRFLFKRMSNPEA